MCKVFCISNMSKLKSVDKSIEVIAKHITKYETDGFGYAIHGAKGIYGERTTEPSTFEVSFNRAVLNLPFVESNYNRFGDKAKPIGAGIFHGRTSTNHATLINTHPIIKHDWTLIHNGVVSNQGPAYPMITTNDTEHLVHYMASGGLDAVAKNLSGYYAVAAFSPDKKLHIFRDDRATLYMAFSETLDSYIVATTSELIKSVCTELKWEYSVIGEVSANSYFILNGNDVESMSTFKPLGSTKYEDSYASKSLSYIDGVETEYHGFTPSEVQFLEEIRQYADNTYKFYDYRHHQLSLSEFLDLEVDEQLTCIVVRSDGTLVDPEDYERETLYDRGA